MSIQNPILPDTDSSLLTIKMCVEACKNTNKILAKYGRITPKLPIVVPHTLFHGSAGCGKTTRAEQAARLMGCSEEDGTFIRINSDCIKKIEDIIEILMKKLSWEGYLCSNGKTSHAECNPCNHQIVDPVNPRGPVKQVTIFLDEIHTLSPDIQEKLGLILLDFRYQLVSYANLKTYYFPKFTLIGATTRPGDLIRPLRTRFGNKFSVGYHTDEEMENIVASMAADRGWNIDNECKQIVARISQGIPREADNHLSGVFNCWIYLLNTGQITDKHVITKEVALQYIKLKNYIEDGLSYDQVKVLKYLASFVKDGKPRGVGVSRICGALGLDSTRYTDEIEPRLSSKGLVSSGGRGREVTLEGMQYLDFLSNTNSDFATI